MSAVVALAVGGRIVRVERASVAVVFFVDVCHFERWNVKLWRDIKMLDAR